MNKSSWRCYDYSWCQCALVTQRLRSSTWFICISCKESGCLCLTVAFTSQFWQSRLPHHIIFSPFACLKVILQLNPCQLLTMACCVCKDLCDGCVWACAHIHVQQLSAAYTSSSQRPKHSGRLLPKLIAASPPSHIYSQLLPFFYTMSILLIPYMFHPSHVGQEISEYKLGYILGWVYHRKGKENGM